MSQVERVATSWHAHLHGYKVIVTKSTVPVGTGAWLRASASSEARRDGGDVRRRVESGVSPEGLGGQRFHAPRPRRHRHDERARGRGHARDLPAAVPDRERRSS